MTTPVLILSVKKTVDDRELDIFAVSDLNLSEKINIKTDDFLDGYKKEKVFKKMVINGQKMFVLFKKYLTAKYFLLRRHLKM